MHSELLDPEQLLNPPEDSCGRLKALVWTISCTSDYPSDPGRFVMWSVATRQDSVGHKRPEGIGAFRSSDGVKGRNERKEMVIVNISS